MDLGPFRSFMAELALESGAFIRPYFGDANLKVELKSDRTPVTVADRGAEELMRKAIRRRFPSHGIIGEEYGSQNADAEFVWVLDPIDGTKSFVTGVPLWGTLIALLHRGMPLLGCINQPVLGQLMLGDGTVATLNGKRVKCRPTTKLAEAVLLTSCPVNFSQKQGAARTARFLEKPRLVRTWGDCYGYLLVASGRADVMLDPIMNLWDIAALVPIIRGAGGVISDWKGGAPFPADSIVAAATPRLHTAVLAALRR